jgi:hypothetical protein
MILIYVSLEGQTQMSIVLLRDAHNLCFVWWLFVCISKKHQPSRPDTGGIARKKIASRHFIKKMDLSAKLERVPRDPKVILGALVITILVTLWVAYFLFRCSKFSRSLFGNVMDEDVASIIKSKYPNARFTVDCPKGVGVVMVYLSKSDSMATEVGKYAGTINYRTGEAIKAWNQVVDKMSGMDLETPAFLGVMVGVLPADTTLASYGQKETWARNSNNNEWEIKLSSNLTVKQMFDDPYYVREVALGYSNLAYKQYENVTQLRMNNLLTCITSNTPQISIRLIGLRGSKNNLKLGLKVKGLSTTIVTTSAGFNKDVYVGTDPVSPSDITLTFGDGGDIYFDEIRIVATACAPNGSVVSKNFKSMLFSTNKKQSTDALYWSGTYVFK